MIGTLVGCKNGEIANEDEKIENEGIANDKIRIKQYKGLEVTETTLEVTDEDVQMSIDSTLSTLSTKTDITDRPAQEGDLVVIDYEGKLDGVAFDGGTAKQQSVEISESSGYVPGFAEGIVGHSIGETFDVDVTFPENYHENLAGKAVVFTMTLHSIQEVHVPELTEELLPQLSKTAKTIKEYKEEVRADLEKSNKESIESYKEQQVWSKLIENCVVDKYPDGQVEEFVANVETQLSEAAKSSNMTAAELFKSYYGITPEEYVKNSVKLEYAIELIADKEKITLTEKEYQDGLKEQAAQNGYDDVDEFEKTYGHDTIELLLLQPKVGKFLVDNCKVVKAESTK